MSFFLVTAKADVFKEENYMAYNRGFEVIEEQVAEYLKSATERVKTVSHTRSFLQPVDQTF